MGDLHDEDILLWRQQQAELLRRHAADANDPAIDWPDILEEVEDVGRNTLRACRSLLLQALLHDLKAEAWPLSLDVPYWRSEARVARINATDAYAPLCASGSTWPVSTPRRCAPSGHRRRAAPLPVPDVCPVTLDELLAED